jgi:hypothetical protein
MYAHVMHVCLSGMVYARAMMDAMHGSPVPRHACVRCREMHIRMYAHVMHVCLSGMMYARAMMDAMHGSPVPTHACVRCRGMHIRMYACARMYMRAYMHRLTRATDDAYHACMPGECMICTRGVCMCRPCMPDDGCMAMHARAAHVCRMCTWDGALTWRRLEGGLPRVAP